MKLYKPKLDDLWFRRQLLADEKTMSYNHKWSGTIDFKEDMWNDWYNYWIINHNNKRYYRYLKDNDGNFIGEVAYHYDEEENKYLASIIIYAKYRNKGYGSIALEMLCEAAKENEIAVLYDDIAIDNPAISMFLKHGFIEEYRTDEKIYLKKIL